MRYYIVASNGKGYVRTTTKIKELTLLETIAEFEDELDKQGNGPWVVTFFSLLVH